MRLSFNEGFGVRYHNTINALTWGNIKGGHTRTDIAFRKAGEVCIVSKTHFQNTN